MKLSVFLQKRPEMATDQFRQWWLEHVKISRNIPGLRGYRINFVDEIRPYNIDRRTVEYDGTAELNFGEVGSLESGFDSPVAREAIEDADRTCIRRVEFITQEKIIIPGPSELPGALKLVVLLRKKPELNIEEFHRRILEHAQLICQIPGLKKYCLNLIERVQGAGFAKDDVEFHVSGEQWFDDRRALEAGYASKIAQRALKEAEAQCAVRVWFLTKENIIVKN